LIELKISKYLICIFFKSIKKNKIMTKFFTKCLGLLCLTALCFSLNSMAQPANDVCIGAIDIVCGGSESGTTAGANNTGVSFCGTSNTAPDV